MRTFAFTVGLAAGYVLGARVGRQRATPGRSSGSTVETIGGYTTHDPGETGEIGDAVPVVAELTTATVDEPREGSAGI